MSHLSNNIPLFLYRENVKQRYKTYQNEKSNSIGYRDIVGIQQ